MQQLYNSVVDILYMPWITIIRLSVCWFSIQVLDPWNRPRLNEQKRTMRAISRANETVLSDKAWMKQDLMEKIIHVTLILKAIVIHVHTFLFTFPPLTQNGTLLLVLRILNRLSSFSRLGEVQLEYERRSSRRLVHSKTNHAKVINREVSSV